VAGLLADRGRFYYHAWAEVYLGDWVPVDPMLGEAPADAGHVRLMIDAFAEPLALGGVIGHVGLDSL
jgi:hypothetical protein